MLFRAAVACYEIVRQCLCCLFLSILSRPVRFVSSYPPCLVLFLLLRLVSSCPFSLGLFAFSRPVRLASSSLVLSVLSPSCMSACSPVRLCLVLSALSRPVRLASSCLVVSVLSRPVCFCYVMSVSVSSCPPCLVLSVLSRPVRLVSFHLSGLVLSWFVLSVLSCLIRLVSVSYFMNPNHDIPNTQSRPTSCKTEDYFLSCLQFCHAYNFLSCMTANVGR